MIAAADFNVLKTLFHKKEEKMISPIWHGWTPNKKADPYENLLRKEGFTGIKSRRNFLSVRNASVGFL